VSELARFQALVVDDEEAIRNLLGEILGGMGLEVRCASSGEEAILKVRGQPYDLVLTDFRLPGVDGLAVLEAVREAAPETSVILITGFGSIAGAVEAMKRGAFDYLAKPFTVDAVEVVVRKALEFRRLREENRSLRSQFAPSNRFEDLVGKSKAMQDLFELIETLARSRATVLVSGESGTGKELVARALHRRSPRRNEPFVRVNCAALPGTLFESELFGHEKGAFTGAIRQNPGRFELAHGGTLLLDEVSEIGPPAQAKILRVLQEREFERLGSGQPIPVDVRIIATTHHDPRALVREGKLRLDLFYRLAVLSLQLPPLRARKEDLPLLVQHFIGKHNEENGRSIRGCTPEALGRLLAYDWPGNVRELENAVERAVIVCPGPELRMEDLPLDLTESRPAPGPSVPPRPAGSSLEALERETILRTLESCGGNRTLAARILGITCRTLRNKLHQYGAMGAFKRGALESREKVLPGT
jgi:DNA-binding NtrC family response regulator